MWRRILKILFVTVGGLIALTVIGRVVIAYLTYVPDLSLEKSAELISHVPEVNNYARLVRMESLYHLKGSTNRTSLGTFTFQYLDAPTGVPTIKANADFIYMDGRWRLDEFYYKCPGTDCQIVDVNIQRQ